MADYGIGKSERYEVHGLSETVAVTRADEHGEELYLLEIAHKGIDYELTRSQMEALSECIDYALNSDG